jgi:alpha-N-acetylglucosamine transferase
VIITLYIDDLILPSNDLILLKGTKDNLLNFFETVDLGEVQYCLRIQNRTIYLNQNKYIGGILKQFGMVKNKLVRITFMFNCNFSKDMNPQNDVDLETMWVIMF